MPNTSYFYNMAERWKQILRLIMNHGSSGLPFSRPVLHLLQLPKLIMRPPSGQVAGRRGHSSQTSEFRTQLHPLKAASRARKVCRGPCKAQVSSLPKQMLLNSSWKARRATWQQKPFPSLMAPSQPLSTIYFRAGNFFEFQSASNPRCTILTTMAKSDLRQLP